MKVTRLDGALLDYWVAKSEGLKLLPNRPLEGEIHVPSSGFWHPDTYQPSTNWAQGGAIIANEWYDLENVLIEWFGPHWPFIKAIADEPLKWLLRAFVTTRFGEEVEDIEEIRIAAPTPVGTSQYQPSASTRKWPAWFGRDRAGKAGTGSA